MPDVWTIGIVRRPILSLKLRFQNTHLDYFPEDLGYVSEGQDERFHQVIKEIEKDTREDGASQ